MAFAASLSSHLVILSCTTTAAVTTFLPATLLAARRFLLPTTTLTKAHMFARRASTGASAHPAVPGGQGFSFLSHPFKGRSFNYKPASPLHTAKHTAAAWTTSPLTSTASRRTLCTTARASHMAPASATAPSSQDNNLSLAPPRSPLHPCGQLSPSKALLGGAMSSPFKRPSGGFSPSLSHSVPSGGAPAHAQQLHTLKHGLQVPGATFGGTTPAPPSQYGLPQADAHSPASSAGADLNRALKSVCKVFATLASPNFATPWQMHQQSKSTASSFVVAPLSARRILTNAHAVANQIQVQLRKHGNARKFNARVVAVGHECDIAMLTVDDDEFWTGVEALEIGGLPDMQESVSVVGYPTGGDNVCVTKGVVSRLDRQQYSHGRTSLLALQIDAAINSGNSGGPVIKGDKLVGIAFQCLTAGENIGYVIPVPVINHFLQDLDRHSGRYTGFCDLGVCWQTLESTDHKAALRMPRTVTGVYVNAVEPCHHAAQVLQAGDVITHFNGHALADDGTFLFDPEEQVWGCSTRFLPGRNATANFPAASTDPSHLLSPKRAAAPHPAQLLLPATAATASDDGSGAVGNRPTETMTCVSATCDTPPEATPAAAEGAAGAMTLQHSAVSAGDTLSLANAAAIAAPPPMVLPRWGAGNTMVVTNDPQQLVRIDFRHLVSMNFEGDECELGVWRDGAPLPGGVRVELCTPQQLVPVHSHDLKPHYYIYGGLVFTRLTNFYLRSTYGADWTHKAPIKLCDRSFAGVLEAPGEEVVVLSKVLAWDCNTGYQELGNVEVLKVAGVPVHNLAHVAYVLQNHPGPYVRLDLQWNKVVMLDTAQCHAAAEAILTQNCIPGNGYFPRDLLKSDLQLPAAIQAATDKVLNPAARTPASPAAFKAGHASPSPPPAGLPVPATAAASEGLAGSEQGREAATMSSRL